MAVPGHIRLGHTALFNALHGSKIGIVQCFFFSASSSPSWVVVVVAFAGQAAVPVVATDSLLEPPKGKKWCLRHGK